MPFTNIARAELEALSFAFERRYASTNPKDIPADEHRAQVERDIAIRVADRSAAIAEGNGALFDALCNEDCNTVDRAERDRLWWEKYGLFSARSASKEAA